MRQLQFLVFMCVSVLVYSQDSTRGLSIVNTGKEIRGTTRALVVGISGYQNLPLLQYADKDAIEFAYFLTHNKAWQVSEDNVRLLTNDKAKAGDIVTWLNWLLENSKAGDNIVFYFSGHGDVETSNDISKGYLLAYDSPKNNYITGAISVDLLRQIYTEMIDKGIKLYMITDACRAGHLAGGNAGAKTTAEAFSKQWRNEVKILSAQPDELSYEGSQWGGGRGVFSFFLTKGLSGFADVNKDSSITLFEIEQYVGQQVSQETGFKQQPVFEGGSKYSNKIARLDNEGMNRYQQYKSNDIAVLVVKGSNDIDAGDCTALFEQLKTDIDAIKDSVSISKAVTDYDALTSCNNTSVRDNARFRLTASLLNYVQQIVNHTLIGKKLIAGPQLEEGMKVIALINNINRQKPLVNRAHLENIRRYFTITHSSLWSDEELTPELHQQLHLMLDSALRQEPGAAYLELTRGILYMNTEEYDSALISFQQAILHSPTWLMAYYDAAAALEGKGMYKEAAEYLEKILTLDSAYQTFECARCFYNELGEYYAFQKKWDKAEQYFHKADTDNEFTTVKVNLVHLYHQRKQYDKRNLALKELKAMNRNIGDELEYFALELELGLLNKKISQQWLDSVENIIPSEDEAEFYYIRAAWNEYYKYDPIDYYRLAYEADPSNFSYTGSFIQALVDVGEFEEAEDVIKDTKPRLKKSEQAILDNALAACYTYTKREKEGFELYRKLVNQGYLKCKALRTLKPLHKLTEYKVFMAQCR